MLFRFLALIGLALCAVAPAAAQDETFPEAASGLAEQKGGTATSFMVRRAIELRKSVGCCF